MAELRINVRLDRSWHAPHFSWGRGKDHLVVEHFFKDGDKNTEFEALANQHLLEIASLRLDWLHVRPLPKTLWLAKDKLGFSRIMTFVYGKFFPNIQLRETTSTTKKHSPGSPATACVTASGGNVADVSTRTSCGGHRQAHKTVSVVLPSVLPAPLRCWQSLFL